MASLAIDHCHKRTDATLTFNIGLIMLNNRSGQVCSFKQASIQSRFWQVDKS
jgi:hypothetical protein